VLILRGDAVTQESFAAAWEKRAPVVVRGIAVVGRWTPSELAQDFCAVKVSPINCLTGQTVKGHTVGSFFSKLENADFSDTPPLKLKDWPSRNDFLATFPKLFKSFYFMIPEGCKEMCKADGIMNMASFYADNDNKPDLGPKMYVANGNQNANFGTTNLHADVTCAVNNMLWCSDPSRPGAIWQVFRFEDSDQICRYLIETHGVKNVHPIHSQTVWLTETMLSDLVAIGVVVYTIEQYVGDMVFIPAGCAHQVRNTQNAIKAACDFISLQNLHITAKLLTSQRDHRLRGGGHSGEDILQLNALLFRIWSNMAPFIDNVLASIGKCSHYRRRAPLNYHTRAQQHEGLPLPLTRLC
ncbi:uncharacterized protein BXZ73DRAFT_56799, partial [Epithele typhae]|uniref:uncharacterized protein n=1 Tax=Epithele typhae TaxID=378194 RepID=UPI0020077F75